jgi:hypothetical protein
MKTHIFSRRTGQEGVKYVCLAEITSLAGKRVCFTTEQSLRNEPGLSYCIPANWEGGVPTEFLEIVFKKAPAQSPPYTYKAELG